MSDLISRDLLGMRFGNLTVLRRSGVQKSPCGTKRALWLCKCDCGNETTVSRNNLIQGMVVSCGCHKTKLLNAHNTVHGGIHDRLYEVWRGMKQRCNNPNDKRYKYYGGTGIKVCEEWENNYPKFKEWAYRNGYNDKAEYSKCTIDRIDPYGNYEPSNCRWVDMAVQNKSDHKRKGVFQCI